MLTVGILFAPFSFVFVLQTNKSISIQVIDYILKRADGWANCYSNTDRRQRERDCINLQLHDKSQSKLSKINYETGWWVVWANLLAPINSPSRCYSLHLTSTPKTLLESQTNIFFGVAGGWGRFGDEKTFLITRVENGSKLFIVKRKGKTVFRAATWQSFEFLPRQKCSSRGREADGN